MITNTGKKIIAKFLLGQTSEFATHIAAGCGPTPLSPTESLTTQEVIDIKNKTNLDFEMFRVPIISKGFIKENGVEKIVFKAEMPTEQRYQITEVGFFSGAANTLAGSFDSKTLSTFNPAENWIIASDVSASTITTETINANISNSLSDFILTDKAKFVPSDATVFNSINRKDRQEPPRFYNRALLVSGNSCYLDSDGTSYNSYGYRIENTSLAFNFSQNLPSDQIRFAISILSNIHNNDTEPYKVRFAIEFINNLPTLSALSPKARATMVLDSSDIADSRYYIFTKPLSSFKLDDGFSWANINLIRIYACVIDQTDVIDQITNVALNQSVATVTAPEHGLYPGMKFDISGVSAPYSYFNQTNLTVVSSTESTITFNHPTANSASPISASVISGSAQYEGGNKNYKILLDGLRFENTTTDNPLYSLVGYDIVRESSSYPVIKTENSNNYIEYRFGIGVDIG
jgi:hypothetical protein